MSMNRNFFDFSPLWINGQYDSAMAWKKKDWIVSARMHHQIVTCSFLLLLLYQQQRAPVAPVGANYIHSNYIWAPD